MLKKLIYVLIVALMLMSSFALAQLRIGIIGDQTGSSDLAESYEILQEGCEVIDKYNPDLVLHVGDLVESSKSNEEITIDFKQAVGYLNSIKKSSNPIPWYITAGDHDVNPPNDYTPGTKNREKEKLFLELIQDAYAKRGSKISPKNLYYSFDYGGYHFICLYSEDNLRTDPRWGNIFMNKIIDNQYNWLKADLQNASSSNGTIVFVHQPMWYNVTGWKKVHNLLREYSVMAVIAGHYHYNQDEGTIDGIRYLVVGSTGGNIKKASENAGGLYHVTLLTLNGKEIKLELIPLAGYSNNAFTRRVNMDRIQAIDCMLGDLKWDSTNKLNAQANPIDIPINIYSYQGKDSWLPLYNNVSPGKGVSISNLSSVDLDNGDIPTGIQGMKIQFQDNYGQLFWDSMIFNSVQL
jgi:predicted phosphodiesterase